MNNKNRTISSIGGFTLLELIVALALMDIIALALYSSMHTGFNAKSKSHSLLKPYESIVPAFEFIRRDLVSAVKPDGILAGVFIGENESGLRTLDADTLSLYTCGYQPEDEEASSNIINIRYGLEDDIETDKIVLKRFVTKNILSPGQVAPEEEVICRGIAGLDIYYYDGSGWVENWDSSEHSSRLPLGVKITISITDQDSPLSDENGFRNFTRIYLLPFYDQGQEGLNEDA